EEQQDEGSLDTPQTGRIYVGVGLATFLGIDPDTREKRTYEMIRPGEDVRITTYSAGAPQPKFMYATVVDTFRTGMAEYDSDFVYCNLERLQELRGMVQTDGSRAFTSLQIKLKDYKHAREVVEILRANFDPQKFNISTWEQKQGPLLSAVDVESSI